MVTLITIFYVSLLALLAMIFLKRREIVSGRQSVVSKIGSGTDHVFQKIFSHGNKAVSYANRHTVAALLHWIAYHVLYFIRKVYVEIKHRFMDTTHGKKLIDAVRGRGEVKDHGASFFLRRISAEHQVK